MKFSQVILISIFAAILGANAAAESGQDDFHSGAVCLNRAVATPDGESAFSIIVSEESVPAMEAKGFTALECRQAFASRQEAILFRDWVCSNASTPEEAVQQQFERGIGERAAVLCGMAEIVLGQWQREGVR